MQYQLVVKYFISTTSHPRFFSCIDFNFAMPQLQFQQQKLIEAKLAGASERTCKSLARDNECFLRSMTAVKRCSSGSDVTLALLVARTGCFAAASWGMLFLFEYRSLPSFAPMPCRWNMVVSYPVRMRSCERRSSMNATTCYGFSMALWITTISQQLKCALVKSMSPIPSSCLY